MQHHALFCTVLAYVNLDNFEEVDMNVKKIWLLLCFVLVLTSSRQKSQSQNGN